MLLSRAAGSNAEKDFDPSTGVLERQRKVGSEILTRLLGFRSDRERWATDFGICLFC